MHLLMLERPSDFGNNTMGIPAMLPHGRQGPWLLLRPRDGNTDVAPRALQSPPIRGLRIFPALAQGLGRGPGLLTVDGRPWGDDSNR
eukprot:1051478-Alexandrium_andersonii.AAC.1